MLTDEQKIRLEAAKQAEEADEAASKAMAEESKQAFIDELMQGLPEFTLEQYHKELSELACKIGLVHGIHSISEIDEAIRGNKLPEDDLIQDWIMLCTMGSILEENLSYPVRIIKSSQLSAGMVVTYLGLQPGVGGVHKIRCADGNIMYLSMSDRWERVNEGAEK